MVMPFFAILITFVGNHHLCIFYILYSFEKLSLYIILKKIKKKYLLHISSNYTKRIMITTKKNTERFEDEELSFSDIYTQLKNNKGNIMDDLAFAKLIISNNPEAVNYFLGEYSIRFLRYIANNILHLNNNYEYGEPCNLIQGDYYIFIAAPFNCIKNNIPEWHKIALYKSKDEARLYTYVSHIAKNHFIKNKIKYKNEKKATTELLEYMDYDALLKYDYADENIDENTPESLQNLHKAFISLSEKDQVVLQYLVMDKMHWSDAFEELRVYLDPLGPDDEWKSYSYEEKQKAIDRCWEPKQKQDAMAGLKKRAIAHLSSRFSKLKK